MTHYNILFTILYYYYILLVPSLSLSHGALCGVAVKFKVSLTHFCASIRYPHLALSWAHSCDAMQTQTRRDADADATRRDAMWCDATRRDATRRDATWCDATPGHVMWCEVLRCDMMRADLIGCDMMWYDVMWCDVMWCGVTWCRCEIYKTAL